MKDSHGLLANGVIKSPKILQDWTKSKKKPQKTPPKPKKGDGGGVEGKEEALDIGERKLEEILGFFRSARIPRILSGTIFDCCDDEYLFPSFLFLPLFN